MVKAGYQLTYDDASRIDSIYSYLDAGTSYEYDDTDQLTAAYPTYENAENYSYDDNGNRTNYGTYIGNNNQLLSDGAGNYTYDDEGNRITRTDWTGHLTLYRYDHRNRLVGVEELDPAEPLVATSRIEYAYDVFNQLIRRSVDDDADGPNDPTDTFYAFEAGQIVLQFDGDAASDLSHRFLWNPAAVDQLLADEQVTSLSSAGAVLWPLADHLGTIRDLATHNSTNHTTTIANHRKYDSFGNLISETNAAIDEIFGYTGRLFDEATGLQYNLNRWYDAKSGRWTSEDPIGFAAGDANLQRYVGNSPTDGTDPSGTITVKTIGNPQNQKEQDPGGFDVLWRFRLDKPAPADGYMVQRVEWVWNYVSSTGIPINKKLVYYEVWHVKEGQIKTVEEGHLVADGDTATDNGIENRKPGSGGGTISQNGVIKFWTCHDFDPKKEGFKPNVVMPVPDSKGRKVTPAGPLLALQVSPGPDRAFWNKPPSNGEAIGTRGVTVTWRPHVVTVYP